MSKILIKLENIYKKFGDGQIKSTVLSDINLTINEGEFIAISGPSGCGKSTLLCILGLLDTPSAGDYQLTTIQTSGLKLDQRAHIRNKHIGFVFQSFNLIDGLNVFDNVALPLEHRGASSKHIKTQVAEKLAAVNLASRSLQFPNQLSGGQQQRVAIARALVGEPDLILVDEPTGNLDSQNGDAVMQLLLELNRQGKTIVMVTHDERYSRMAKRQIRLFDGKILMEKAEAVA